MCTLLLPFFEYFFFRKCGFTRKLPDTLSCSPFLRFFFVINKMYLLVFSTILYIALCQNCGVPCQTNNDCRNDALCNMCRAGACTSGGNCKDYCNTNQDCYATWCNTCINHACKVSCRERCVHQDDCGAPCNQCMQGVCQVAGCGSACTDWRDCITPDCKQCFQGVCKPGGCGVPCILGSDCYGQGNCTTCSLVLTEKKKCRSSTNWNL